MQIDPSPLLLSEEGVAGPSTEVTDDDTARISEYAVLFGYGNSPEEQSQDDHSAEKIEKNEVDCVPLRGVGLRLLSQTNDRHSCLHDVYPTFQGNNFEQNQERLPERVESPDALVQRRIGPDAGDQIRQRVVDRSGEIFVDAISDSRARRVVA